MSAPQVICAAAAAECQCSLAPGHDGPHHCQRAGCGGMWKGTAGGDDFEIVRFPGEGRLLAANCRCNEVYVDAACPEHGLLAFLARGIAAQEAIDEIAGGPDR